MTTIEIKAKMHERIEHLTEDQIKKLYSIMEEEFETPTSIPSPSRKRQLGIIPGLIKYMASDFDEPLEDFEEYMPSQNSKG
ncbi:MAG: hypothetical protein AAF944_09970 [Bacteroidota bacterium]